VNTQIETPEKEGKKEQNPKAEDVRLGRCNEIHRGSQSTAYLDHIIFSGSSKQRAGLSAVAKLWTG